MIKKAYLQPTMNIVKLQQQHQLLAGSTTTSGLGEELKYDETDPSANPSDAW